MFFLVLSQLTVLLVCSLSVRSQELRGSMVKDLKTSEDDKNLAESSLRKTIQRVSPTPFFLNQAKLRGSESNDIVLMAALKGNGRSTTIKENLLDEEIEEEQEIIREKEKKKEILDEEIETEIEKEVEEEILEERNPMVAELERERLNEEILEEGGYPLTMDQKFNDARHMLHAYVGEDDGQLHYKPLIYASSRFSNGNNFLGNNHHLTNLLSHCSPNRLHHLIQMVEQCNREYSIGYHHY